MNQMQFIRKLPEPAEVKREVPLSAKGQAVKEERDRIIADIIEGRDDRFLLIIGPCSADNEPAVLDYCTRRERICQDDFFNFSKLNKPAEKKSS